MLAATRHALLLSAELLRLLDLFDRHAIPVLPFKGPVLADILYGDIAARESCDLDIMVRKSDIPRVTSALLAEGYTTDLPVDPAIRTAYLRARYEIHFTSPKGGIAIELHQAFLPPAYCFEFDYDAMWQRLEHRLFFGRPILALPPADLLLVLCAHGAKHAWADPNLIRDVARLLSMSASYLRWPEILDRARAAGARRIVLLGLYLAARRFAAPIPDRILAQAEADHAVVRLARGGSEGHAYFLKTRERFRDRLACYARLAVSPNEEDYALARLPDQLSALYYLLHAFRVSTKHGLAALSTLLQCHSTYY
jgi:Uncharacterised nucleotidyltransferase